MNTAAGNLKAVELTITDKVDLAKIHDLQGMSLQAELTVSGMDSAEQMIAELETMIQTEITPLQIGVNY